MTTSVGSSVSVSSGVISLIVTNFCSYDEMGGSSSVWITADSGNRSGETARNMFCLQSLFQYLSNGPSVRASALCVRAASSSQTVSWIRGECRASVMSGKGLGSGCRRLCCAHACLSVYSLLRDLRIVSELGLAVGS